MSKTKEYFHKNCNGIRKIDDEFEFLQYLHEEAMRLKVKISSAPSDPLSASDIEKISKAIEADYEKHLIEEAERFGIIIGPPPLTQEEINNVNALIKAEDTHIDKAAEKSAMEDIYELTGTYPI